MLKEFKEFAMKGSVMDLAIGVIIGGAFGKIISSMVDDMLIPVIGFATGGVDFANKFVPLKGQTATDLVSAKKEGAVLAYGLFLNNVIQFLIIAFFIFLMVKAINKMKKPEPEAAPAGPSSEQLLTEIRDLLRK